MVRARGNARLTSVLRISHGNGQCRLGVSIPTTRPEDLGYGTALTRQHSSAREVCSLRIAIVSGTFHPEAGGPPTYLYRLGSALTGRGHRVRVATYGESHPASAYPYPVSRISRHQ